MYPNSGPSKNVPEAGIPYIVSVYTGDVRNAGTSAKVFVEFYGDEFMAEESSGRIQLTDGKFERGLVDKLHVQSPKMLSPLSKLLIGHDNSGAGPGF